MNGRSVLAVWLSVTACSLELAPLDTGAPAGAGGQGGSGGATGGASGASGVGGTGGTGGLPKEGPQIGNFQFGFYWLVLESDFSGAKTALVYDIGCKALATVSPDFSVALAGAGRGILSDGRVLSYAGSCGCPTTPCYVEADAAHPWGYGAQNAVLQPFRSVALDPKQVPFGTALYVPAFDGVAVPGDSPWGGFVHDGCVRADDALVGPELRWFVALSSFQDALEPAVPLSAVIVHEGGTRCP